MRAASHVHDAASILTGIATGQVVNVDDTLVDPE